MGGNLAIQLANRQPDMWNGVVLLAPAIMPHKASTAPWMLYAVRYGCAALQVFFLLISVVPNRAMPY
jgi:pimeloyl-ACP methyl ester carboxylesterase